MAEREFFKEDDQEEYSPADAVEPASILGGLAPIDFGREDDQHDYGETPDTSRRTATLATCQPTGRTMVARMGLGVRD